MTHIERKPITFSKWTPVRRDNAIAYTYIMPRDGRLNRCGGDRWMRAKSRIASSAIATGASEFRVFGGLRTSWVRTVTVTQDEADAFFRHAIDDLGHFMLKGIYRKASLGRERRLNGQG